MGRYPYPGDIAEVLKGVNEKLKEKDLDLDFDCTSTMFYFEYPLNVFYWINNSWQVVCLAIYFNFSAHLLASFYAIAILKDFILTEVGSCVVSLL